MQVPDGWYLRLVTVEISDESGMPWSIETVGEGEGEDDGFAVVRPRLSYWPVFFRRGQTVEFSEWKDPLREVIIGILRRTYGAVPVEQIRVSHGPSARVVARRSVWLLAKLGKPGFAPLYYDGDRCTESAPPEFDD